MPNDRAGSSIDRPTSASASRHGEPVKSKEAVFCQTQERNDQLLPAGHLIAIPKRGPEDRIVCGSPVVDSQKQQDAVQSTS